MFPETATRVEQNTPGHLNAEIERQIERNVQHYASLGPQAIERRLWELDQEWDIERALEANAAVAGLMGLTLGATVDRKWFMLPAVVSGFLLQHALQGWCPPLPIFRQLGFRTMREIDSEREGLKAHLHRTAALKQDWVETAAGRIKKAVVD